jgi:NAD(P)-dependent dehydrogenase (short-subunit alcohol dehydrogenase family)
MLREVALVIGASRGIGRQVAIDLAKNGYAGMFVPSKRGEHTIQLCSLDLILCT